MCIYKNVLLNVVKMMVEYLSLTELEKENPDSIYTTTYSIWHRQLWSKNWGCSCPCRTVHLTIGLTHLHLSFNIYSKRISLLHHQASEMHRFDFQCHVHMIDRFRMYVYKSNLNTPILAD